MSWVVYFCFLKAPLTLLSLLHGHNIEMFLKYNLLNYYYPSLLLLHFLFLHSSTVKGNQFKVNDYSSPTSDDCQHANVRNLLIARRFAMASLGDESGVDDDHTCQGTKIRSSSLTVVSIHWPDPQPRTMETDFGTSCVDELYPHCDSESDCVAVVGPLICPRLCLMCDRK